MKSLANGCAALCWSQDRQHFACLVMTGLAALVSERLPMLCSCISLCVCTYIGVGEQKNQIPCYFSSGWNLFGLSSAKLEFRQCRNSLELGIESVEPRTRVFFSWKLYFCTKGIIWYLRSLWKLSLKNYAKIFMSVGKFQCIKKTQICLQQALPYGNVRFWPAREIRNSWRIQHGSDNDAIVF